MIIYWQTLAKAVLITALMMVVAYFWGLSHGAETAQQILSEEWRIVREL